MLPETTIPPFGGADLLVLPDIDCSQDRVAKALAAGGPGSSPTSHDSDFSQRPGFSTRAATLFECKTAPFPVDAFR